MNNIPISVIIPAYNHANFIAEAIHSVLKQTWSDFELIIIDDGSTDETFDIVNSFDDSRIKAFTQTNQDAFNTINRGLAMAKGDYIAILNSDDVYHPIRLERMHQCALKNNSHCIFTDVQPIDENSEALNNTAHYWNKWHETNREFFFKTGNILTGLLHANFLVTTSNLFIQRTVIEEIGVFSSLRYLHDYDYILRIAHQFPEQVYYLNEKLVNYRIHGSNTLKQGAITAREQDIELIKKYTILSMPKESQMNVTTGIERIVALEKELQTVRYAVQHPIRHALQKKLSILKNICSR